MGPISSPGEPLSFSCLRPPTPGGRGAVPSRCGLLRLPKPEEGSGAKQVSGLRMQCERAAESGPSDIRVHFGLRTRMCGPGLRLRFAVIGECGFQIVDCRLRAAADCGLLIAEYCRLEPECSSFLNSVQSRWGSSTAIAQRLHSDDSTKASDTEARSLKP
jgi:hypothetical protein